MRIKAILFVLLGAVPAIALAQGMGSDDTQYTADRQDAAPASDDPADVWAVVEAQWNAEEKGDRKWLDNLLTDDFSGWSRESPAPRNKASTKMWDRYTDSLGSMTMDGSVVRIAAHVGRGDRHLPCRGRGRALDERAWRRRALPPSASGRRRSGGL